MQNRMKGARRPESSYVSSRVASIDAARGAAMLFVCLAHFANSYQFVSGADGVGGYLVIVGMLASPTFVTVSGLVAGFLSVTRSASFIKLQRKLLDRGLFLLIVGHTILAASGMATGRGFSDAFKIGYITDAIGFAVVLGPWLVSALRRRSRLVLAAVVYLLSWAAVLFWTPTGFAAIAKQYLIGIPNVADWTRGDFPLIPWFAVYLTGTVIGETLGQYYSARVEKSGHVFLAKVGAASLGFGLLAKGAFFLLHRSQPNFPQLHPALTDMLSSYQKFPPGPVYLTFFGGAGMLLVAAILEVGRRGAYPRSLNQLRQIGLASLFIYVAQFYLYSVILRDLRIPYGPFWPLLFIASLIILAKAAALWNSVEGNRFLTIGVGPLLEWNARRRTVASAPKSAQGAESLVDPAVVRERTATTAQIA